MSGVHQYAVSSSAYAICHGVCYTCCIVLATCLRTEDHASSPQWCVLFGANLGVQVVVCFLKVPCHASAPNQPRVGDAEERVGAPSTLSTLSTLSYPRTHCGSCTYTLCTTAAPTFHACEWTPLRSQCVSAAQPDARHANAITRAADVPTRSRSHGIGGPVQPCGFRPPLLLAIRLRNRSSALSRV